MKFRHIISSLPEESEQGFPVLISGRWAARWISGAAGAEHRVVAYRCDVPLTQPQILRFRLTAAARYRLFHAGVELADGPESGDGEHMFFNTYELELPAGTHRLVIVVSSFGHAGPCALMEGKHGLLVAGEGIAHSLLSTGVAHWEALILTGIQWHEPTEEFFRYMGIRQSCDQRQHSPSYFLGTGGEWHIVQVGSCGMDERVNEYRRQPLLTPAPLPSRRGNRITGIQVLHVDHHHGRYFDSDATPVPAEWQEWMEHDTPLTLAPHTHYRVLLELADYECFHYLWQVDGGRDSQLVLSTAEALFLENRADAAKGDRRKWQQRWFVGMSDEFIPDGEADNRFFNHWRCAGRFLLLEITTAATTLTLRRLDLTATAYPLHMEGYFRTSLPFIHALTQTAERTLRMCSHDTFMDCPYYEQMMYLGDTRIQMLLTEVFSRDLRLVEKSLRLFAEAQLPDGLLPSRHPSDRRQIIPPFALIWIGMLHDYVLWHGANALAHELLPTAFRIIAAFESRGKSANGLIRYFRSWNFMDWAYEWSQSGVPAADPDGVSAPLNALYGATLRELGYLCRMLKQQEMAEYCEGLRRQHGMRFHTAFWDEATGLYSDVIQQPVYSEHTQALAVLADFVPSAQRDRLRHQLLTRSDLIRTSCYFSHYLFEAYAKLHCPEQIPPRLNEWFHMLQIGCVTLSERPEPSRSDCHSWSAHPWYHLVAAIAGIRPTAPGLQHLQITPAPGEWPDFAVQIPHPAGGVIKMTYRRYGEEERFEIQLSAGVKQSKFHYRGQTFTLSTGSHQLCFTASDQSRSKSTCKVEDGGSEPRHAMVV